MFDIGFAELLVIAVITLLVMGPERLPQAVRTIALWLGRAKQAFAAARRELENEIGVDEVRRQLHNEQIMRDLNAGKTEMESVMKQATHATEEIKQASTIESEKPSNGSSSKAPQSNPESVDPKNTNHTEISTESNHHD